MNEQKIVEILNFNIFYVLDRIKIMKFYEFNSIKFKLSINREYELILNDLGL